LRLEKVPSVVVRPPLTTCTESRSYAVVVVVSELLTERWNDSVALAADGIATVWARVSLRVVP